MTAIGSAMRLFHFSEAPGIAEFVARAVRVPAPRGPIRIAQARRHMFTLSAEGFEALRSQFVTSNDQAPGRSGRPSMAR